MSRVAKLIEFWCLPLEQGYFTVNCGYNCHAALAKLQDLGHISTIVTQNVDRLHQKSGAIAVVDLHGRSDEVVCMSCHHVIPRIKMRNVHALQHIISSSGDVEQDLRADGHANLLHTDYSSVHH